MHSSIQGCVVHLRWLETANTGQYVEGMQSSTSWYATLQAGAQDKIKKKKFKIKCFIEPRLRHRRAGCAIADSGSTYLCFHYHTDKLCYMADNPLGNFEAVASSRYGHRATRLGLGFSFFASDL